LQAAATLAVLQIPLHRTDPDPKPPSGCSLGLTFVHRSDNALAQVKRIRPHAGSRQQLACLAHRY